ncbi:MAG: hypothetical protein WBO43_16625, partial [Gemmatimonadota bacterium]
MKRLTLHGIRTVAVCLVALLSQVGTGAAQVYDQPQFITPYGETGFGAYFIIVNEIDDPGGMATYRKAGDVNLGVR